MDVFTPFVSITERVQLRDLGINLADIRWSRLRVTSHLWFCITHKKSDRSVATIYDERCDKVHVYELDGVISSQVNPKGSLVALSTSYTINIINIIDNRQVSWNRFPCKVSYWSWISNDSIAIVGPEHVYVWSVYAERIQESFARHPRTRQGQVTGCQFDPGYQWAIVTLLHQEEEEPVCGTVQIYSAQEDLSNCIEAHAALLTRHKHPASNSESPLLIVAKKWSATSTKISIVDISSVRSCQQSVKSEKFNWTRDDDFPTCILHSESKGLIYLLSKYGSLCVFDLENCTPLIINERICSDIVFACVLDAEADGVIAFSRNGQVLGIQVASRRDRAINSDQITRL